MSRFDLGALPSALFGSGGSTGAELASWDAALRRGLSTTRRIGFLSLAPGAGASTLALHTTRIVAARRSEPVLAVDVSTGEGMAVRLGVEQTRPDETRAVARTSAEAMTGLVERDGLVPVRPEVSEGPVGGWLAEAAPIARFFEVALTDFGARHPLVDVAACAALCDVVCVVTDARRSPVEHARSVAPAIAALPEGPVPVLALVDHAREGNAVARMMEADAPHPVVGIPFDAGLRAGGPPRGFATRRALLRLAAMLISAEREVSA